MGKAREKLSDWLQGWSSLARPNVLHCPGTARLLSQSATRRQCHYQVACMNKPQPREAHHRSKEGSSGLCTLREGVQWQIGSLCGSKERECPSRSSTRYFTEPIWRVLSEQVLFWTSGNKVWRGIVRKQWATMMQSITDRSRSNTALMSWFRKRMYLVCNGSQNTLNMHVIIIVPDYLALLEYKDAY